MNCSHYLKYIKFISLEDLNLPKNSFIQMPTALETTSSINIYFSNRDIYGQSHPYLLKLTKNLIPDILDIKKIDLQLGSPGQFDENGIMPSSALIVEDSIYLYYVGWSRSYSVPYKLSVGLAKGNLESNKFQKISDGPVMSTSFFDPIFVTTPFVTYNSGKFEMLYSSGGSWINFQNKFESRYHLKRSESTDGVSWHKNKNLLGHDDNSNSYARPIVFKNHLIYSKRPNINFRKKGNGYRIFLTKNNLMGELDTCSLSWEDNFEKSADVSYGFPIEINNKNLFFYNGSGFGKYGLHISELNFD